MTSFTYRITGSSSLWSNNVLFLTLFYTEQWSLEDADKIRELELDFGLSPLVARCLVPVLKEREPKDWLSPSFSQLRSFSDEEYGKSLREARKSLCNEKRYALWPTMTSTEQHRAWFRSLCRLLGAEIWSITTSHLGLRKDTASLWLQKSTRRPDKSNHHSRCWCSRSRGCILCFWCGDWCYLWSSSAFLESVPRRSCSPLSSKKVAPIRTFPSLVVFHLSLHTPWCFVPNQRSSWDDRSDFAIHVENCLHWYGCWCCLACNHRKSIHRSIGTAWTSKWAPAFCWIARSFGSLWGQYCMGNRFLHWFSDSSTHQCCRKVAKSNRGHWTLGRKESSKSTRVGQKAQRSQFGTTWNRKASCSKLFWSYAKSSSRLYHHLGAWKRRMAPRNCGYRRV